MPLRTKRSLCRKCVSAAAAFRLLSHLTRSGCTDAECLAQLALWPDGREALLRDGSVVDALQAVRDQGLSDQSKEIAANALLSLSDEPPPVPSAEEGEHIMMSYQWDVQPAIKRLVANLQLRGYSVWLDIEQVRTLSAESEEL